MCRWFGGTEGKRTGHGKIVAVLFVCEIPAGPCACFVPAICPSVLTYRHDTRSKGYSHCIMHNIISHHMGCSFPAKPRTRGKKTTPKFKYFYLTLGKTMYQGVLRDDERRREKMKKREEALQESSRKRQEYERVQSVTATQQKSV